MDLRDVGWIVGIVLVLGHIYVLGRTAACEKWLRAFPRSRVVGTVLMTMAAVWSFALIWTMDLGEFAHLRRFMLGAIVVGAFLAWRYVEEFLAVRALGMLALLAAEPLLGAAFLHQQETRLLLVVLAYTWIVLGLFWVGMPWVLRDQLTWLTAQQGRLQVAAWGGLAYGAAVLACAALFWK